jgi:hypothetical protein
MLDSTITLTHGEIVVAQDNLTLRGPNPGNGTVAISASHASRVLHHSGSQTVTISSLIIEDGYATSPNTAYGGCIASSGYVFLSNSIVRNCVASTSGSTNATASGGGIEANKGVWLMASTVTNNQAVAPQGGVGLGGGIYSHHSLSAKYSIISHNLAGDSGGFYGRGGAARIGSLNVSDDVFISKSTINNNQARRTSGLDLVVSTATISDSTISDNFGGYALYLIGTGSAQISNATVAFNRGLASSSVKSGVYLLGILNSSSLSLQSSIFANNVASDGSTPSSDLRWNGYGDFSGGDNLVQITTGTAIPPGIVTITTDPKLGPLQLNGGSTPTHALLPSSPAIAQGNNVAGLATDQRGFGYQRTTGLNATTDIGAFQFDTIFVDPFD